jgi:hypothetical protein
MEDIHTMSKQATRFSNTASKTASHAASDAATRAPASAHHSFTATLQASESRIYQTHLVVPHEIASVLLDEGAKRVVATLTAGGMTVEYQCGLIPRGGGKTVIMVNKEHRSKLGIDSGAAVHVQLRKDKSEYGLAMPEELGELLKQDADGDRLFHALPEGRQRTLLYIVSSVKNSARRIERAIAIVEHLKLRNGKLDYKQLYNDLKMSKRFE